MKCRKCGYDNDPKSLFCEQCGSKLAKKSKPENSEKERKCPQCKHKNKGEYAFCEICGAPLRAKAPKNLRKDFNCYIQFRSFGWSKLWHLLFFE